MERHHDSAVGGKSNPGSLKPGRHLASGRTGLHFPGPYAGSSRLRQGGSSARGILATRRQEISHAIVDGAHGFPYSRKLESHRSCVNAIAFSSKDGRFLASGGDDLRICLWDFYQEDVKTVSHTMTGPKGNIFSLNFSAGNKFLYSAGTCEKIYKYDVAYLGTSAGTSTLASRLPDHLYEDNNDTLRSLTCHPKQDEIFMSASEDGTIRRYDGRQGDRPPSDQDIIPTKHEVTDVKYHPTMEHLFADSNSAGKVFLRDDRMAFGSLDKRSNEGIVQQYITKLTKKAYPHMSFPESSSIAFDKDGTKLAVIFLHFLPTIYAVSDPNPLAVLSGKNLPDGTPVPSNQRKYSNSCTMKHGSFGGPGLDNDDMYAAGSDDFYCYIWKIPPLPQLMDHREIFSAEKWNFYDDESTIAYTEGRLEQKIVPVEISTPLDRLTGHSSIVNTTLFHPHFLHLVTAGIEKDIVLHSPTPSSPCTQNLQRSPARVRELKDDDEEEDRRNFYSALLREHITNTDTADDQAERQNLSLFDHIIREEGDSDVFLTRPWSSEAEDSSDEDSEGGGDDDDSDGPDIVEQDGFSFSVTRRF